MKFKPLVEWMRERQAIYRRREAGQAWPWSSDPIFRDMRFCNVFREQDKTTVWIRENWREPYASSRQLPLAMAMARLLNWPGTLEELGFPKRWNPERFAAVINDRKARGEKTITSAHIVYAVGGVAHSMTKSLNQLHELRNSWVVPSSLRKTFLRLLDVHGVGRFTAYEIVTDLRHTSWLSDADDIMTWCNIGQGSRRGLNRLAGRPLSKVVPEDQAMEEVRWLLNACRESLKSDDRAFRALEMRDVEHSLCELDKYQRVKNGEGVMKERYKQPQETK